jgi:hypothetical protein
MMRADDVADITNTLADCPMDGLWTVVRRGRPGGRIRILWRYRDDVLARARYERERIRARQGMVGLVDPDGRVVSYYSAPMARRRW